MSQLSTLPYDHDGLYDDTIQPTLVSYRHRVTRTCVICGKLFQAYASCNALNCTSERCKNRLKYIKRCKNKSS